MMCTVNSENLFTVESDTCMRKMRNNENSQAKMRQRNITGKRLREEDRNYLHLIQVKLQLLLNYYAKIM